MKEIDLFNRKERTEMFMGKKYAYIEYTCPVCKMKFKGYNGGLGSGGVLVHVTHYAKSEAVAKQLREIKKTPHFDFWKKNTKPMINLYNKRVWVII